MRWTEWLKETQEEGVSSTFLGDATTYTYLPPVGDGPHSLSIVRHVNIIPVDTSAEIHRLAVARTQGVKRDKITITPFSERVGKGQITCGYTIEWHSADVGKCPDCWYLVDGTRCDHPFLRLHQGEVATRTRVADLAWGDCWGQMYRPREAAPIHTTVDDVFS